MRNKPGSDVWAGRSWAALGSSVTQFPAYSSPLADMLGASLTNLAEGGGSISTSAGSAPGGVHGQIARIPADASLVTFEVGMVDFRTNAALGRLYDTTLESFHGALFRCIADTLAAGPRRTIVFITPFGSSAPLFTGQWDAANDNGDRLEDFVRAIRDVCAWCGIAVIDAGQAAGIGGPSAAAYLADGMHLNPAGGLRLAEFLHDRLMFIRPFATPPGGAEAGRGRWKLRSVAPGKLAGTGITVAPSRDRALPVALTFAGTHVFPVLWLTAGADNCIDFRSVPGPQGGLWIVVGAGPAGWVGVGDFGNLGGQRIATFEAVDGAVGFGAALDFAYAVDANARGMRWRAWRLGDVVQIYQQRGEDDLWVEVGHPIDLAAMAVPIGYRAKVRLGILASHGTATAINAGRYTEEAPASP